MQFHRAKDYDEMSRKAANILAAQVLLKPDCVLGLATGSSPIGLYKELIARYRAGDLDFSRVTSVNLDEYVGLTADNDQSYAYFMRENLFKDINIDPKRTFVPDGSNPDAADACARYNQIIRDCGGIDLQLLGLGNNGHIGFNEPCDIFEKQTHCVQLTASTIEANKRFFASEADVPRRAYTMGVGNIMMARRIVVVVSGAGKADIVRDAFCGPVTPQVPASILQMHPCVDVVGDEAAFSKLPL